MFGFFGKGGGNAGVKGTASKEQGGDAFHSLAADALAAAVDHSSSAAVKAGPQPTGRRLRGAASISIDLDALQPREAVAELQVQPITLLKSDFKLAHTQQVAVSNTFICYGLKAGHIRALNRNTADRALFKGHPTAVSHMAFFGPSTPLLASASCKGDLTVRQIAAAPGEGGAEGTITGDVLLHAQLPLPAGAEAAPDGARVTLAWHPVMSQILAAAAGGSVLIYEVPTTAPGGDAQPAPASPGIRYGIAGGASVSSVAFSPTGDLLAAGDSAGGVRVWWMEGDEDTADAPALAWQPFGGSGSIGSVHFLHQAGDGSSLLLTGDATNSSLKLWALPSAAAATAAGDGQQPQCLQSVSFVGSKGGAASPFFCHVAVQPELQVVVLANTARKQVYTLHYSLGADGDMGGAAFDYAAFFSVKQPILSLVALLEAAEASGAGAAAQQQAAAAQQGQQLMLYCVQTEAIQQYTINPALCMAGSAEEEAAEEVGSSSEAAPAPPAADAAASSSSAAAAAAPEPLASNSPAPAAAVPPPAKLPTPTFLGSRAKAAQKAAAAAASPDKGALPAAASRAAKAAAVADNNKKQQAQAEVAPSPESVACDESDSTAAVQAAVDSVEDVAAAAAASPLPPLPTTSLMHSAEKVPAPAAAGADGAAATAARAALAAVAGGAVAAAAGTAAGGSDAAVLQQQMQQLLAMQQQMAGQLHAATQQTVAGVKAEVGKALKASEGSMLKQVDAAIKAAAKKAEEERRKGAAKERQELEKAMAAQLTQTSALMQRDLARVIGDAAREQGRTMVNAIVTSVTPVVASAVAASMQQELAAAAAPGGSLAAALEGSLASSLARPLHEALKANFDVSLIPAFERATQAMFLQVEGAFNNWMAESSGAVAATQAEAASSLSNSLAQLQALVGTMRSELADTSRSLSRMASSAASRGPGDGGSSGAAAAAGSGGGGGGTDPRAEISALLASRNYDGALARALNTASPDTLLWVCKQLDPAQVLGGTTSSLSQTTLLSLVNQLSVNLRADADTAVKLAWLAEAGPVIDPHDRLTAPHMQGVLTGVLNALKALVTSLPPSDGMAKKGKITLHLFNSLLHQ